MHANSCIQACNAGAIPINDSTTPPTTATPYPSVINVSGAIGIFTLVSGVASDPDKQTLAWTPDVNATRYDAVRGSIFALAVGPGGGDEVCFDDLATPSVVDAAMPAVADGFRYLIRGENDCAAGSYGMQSDGTPRVTTTCP